MGRTLLMDGFAYDPVTGIISMEPMIMIPEGMAGAGGYREHDILVLTETGADNITGFAYGPAHNIIS